MDRNEQDRIRREKIELIKLKQGLIEESDLIKEEKQEREKLKGFKRVKNYVYHNRPFILVGLFFAVVFGYMLFDMLSTEKPDIRVLFATSENYSMKMPLIEEAIENYVEDYNGNGKVHVDINYIQLDLEGGGNPDYFAANQTKLIGELAVGKSMLLILDNKVAEYIQGDDNYAIMADLTDMFPDNDLITREGFYLKGSKLAQLAKWESVTDDVFLAVRRGDEALAATEKGMEENYKKALETFKKIVEDELN
ncbi:MAG: hypothetical protein GX967_01460 [Clostridiales bacterium]|nr:hypothetical protein [Clostridiales bacterium]